MIQKITITNAGANTSNGTYIRQTEKRFNCEENENHIELTVDGWLLIDHSLDEQTYMFDIDFQNVFSVGDCIEPVPNFSISA